MVNPRKLRNQIAEKVRELRLARRWTQSELARQLGLSQSRLSEIEGGAGSFTAEQLLVILRLFNVGVEAFAPEPTDPVAQLQNALVRHGATHLVETDLVQVERHADPSTVIFETLVGRTPPRLVTALAPVLVRQVDQLHLPSLGARFAAAGFERRWAWLIENTVEALRRLRATPRAARSRLLNRASTVLEMYLDGLRDRVARPPTPEPDLLDANVRTRRTATELERSASEISKKLRIVTAIQPDDFVEALEAAHDTD